MSVINLNEFELMLVSKTRASTRFYSGLPAAYGFSFDLLFNFNRKKNHSASGR